MELIRDLKRELGNSQPATTEEKLAWLESESKVQEFAGSGRSDILLRCLALSLVALAVGLGLHFRKDVLEVTLDVHCDQATVSLSDTAWIEGIRASSLSLRNLESASAPENGISIEPDGQPHRIDLRGAALQLSGLQLFPADVWQVSVLGDSATGWEVSGGKLKGNVMLPEHSEISIDGGPRTRKRISEEILDFTTLGSPQGPSVLNLKSYGVYAIQGVRISRLSLVKEWRPALAKAESLSTILSGVIRFPSIGESVEFRKQDTFLLDSIHELSRFTLSVGDTITLHLEGRVTRPRLKYFGAEQTLSPTLLEYHFKNPEWKFLAGVLLSIWGLAWGGLGLLKRSLA